MTSPLTTHSPEQDEQLTVLHVDDDPKFGEVTAEFLEREDERFEVVTETSASDGLDRLDVAGIDCIVSDYDMPEMDGLEFLEAVRAERPDLPFILYTGKGSEEIASEAISAGVTDYLEKAAGRHQYTVLVNRVRNAVEQYRAKRQLRETQAGYSRLLQESADFIFTADTERTINYVTPSVERILGYTPDEVIGTDAFEHVHPEDFETAREGFSDVLDPESDETTIEIRVGHRDGFWRWLELRARDLLDDPNVGEFVVNVRDITERKEREQKLRELEEFNQNLLENAPIGLFHLDEELRITYENPRAKEIVGVPSDESKSVAIGEDIRELPSIVETGEAETFARLADGKRIDVEFPFESMYGEKSYLSGRGVPLFDDGKFDGAILILEDVTERRASERELELFRALFDRSEDEIYVVDPDNGEIKLVNDTVCHNLGYEREKLLEMSIQDIDATDVTSEWTSSEWIRARTDEPGELAHERKDGTAYPVEVNATYAELEHDEYVFAIARDLSDRKEREDELEDLHDATRRLMDATAYEDVARIGVEAAEEILDLEIAGFHKPAEDGEALVPVAVTQQARELFGGVPRIERGESLAWQVYETGESIFAENVHDHPEIQNPETPVQSEMLIPARDHGVFIAAATEPDAFDDTDTDLARVLVANLCHAIDRVNRERQLRERERALERENERLEEVASVISHDLRNPLNVIKGRLDMARQEHDSEHFEPMMSSLDRSFDIIEDVLTLVQQGQSIEETEPVTLSTAVENCWHNVDTDEAEFQVESDITFAANLNRFRHVLENLFRNSVEHAGREVTIRVGGLDGGFYVEDDGPGIPPEDRDQVFDSGYSTSDDGTGFGLHIVQQIVDAHGWEIDLTQGDGGGARFEITGVDVAT